MFNRILIYFSCLFVGLANMTRLGNPEDTGTAIAWGDIAICGIGIFIIFSLALNKFLSSGFFILMTVIATVIFVNAYIGIFNYGAQASSIAYSVRLFLISISSISIGMMAIHLKLEYNKLLLKTFVFVVIFGVFLYFIFPDSRNLWSILRSVGVCFEGDPHQSRFYSTFLDPNYAAAILMLPSLMCLSSWCMVGRAKDFFLFLFFSTAIFLTVSRSGCAGLILGIVLVCFLMFSFLSFVRKRVMILSLVIIGGLMVAGLCSSFFPGTSRLLMRFDRIGEDESALARLDSANIGWQLIGEKPILGHGFNAFLHRTADHGRGNLMLDSSIQHMMVSFGIPLTSMFILVVLFILLFFLKESNKLQKKQPLRNTFLAPVVIAYVSNIFVVIIFVSQFNQVILLTWWLVPNLSFGVYLWCKVRSEKTETVLVECNCDSNIVVKQKVKNSLGTYENFD